MHCNTIQSTSTPAASGRPFGSSDNCTNRSKHSCPANSGTAPVIIHSGRTQRSRRSSSLSVSYTHLMAALKGLPRTEAARQIDALLERVSLTEVRRKKIIKLSGGMKRRVGIAQALLNDPEILILDEPTAGLDPGERVRFRNLLSEFAQERIVLISTHIVSDVEYIAAENAVMKAGKIIAQDTTEGLVKQIEAKVWQGNIPMEQLSRWEYRLRVVNLRNEPDGTVTLRYLADAPVSYTHLDVYKRQAQHPGRSGRGRGRRAGRTVPRPHTPRGRQGRCLLYTSRCV